MSSSGAARPHRRVPGAWWALAGAQLLVVIGGAAALPGLVHAHPAAPVPVVTPAVALPSPTADTAGIAAGVQTALHIRDAALLSHNRAGYLAATRPQSAAAAVASALVTNIARVPLSEWRETVDPPSVTRVAALPETFTMNVVRRYRIKGFDPGGLAQRRQLTVARAGKSWVVVSDDPASGVRRELWDTGPVLVRRGTVSLVLAHPADSLHLARYAEIADAAVGNVTAVWGDSWSRHVVVIVPSTAAELGLVLNSGTDYGQIAALATADVVDTGGARTALADRVVINPSNFGRLSVMGQRIVMTHEVTHIASRKATGKASPLWLVEGLADYVAYRHSGVPTRIAARDLTPAVRRAPLPTTLPAEADFSPTAPHLGAAYELSWLACRFIAERTGEAKLLAFYKAVGADTGTRDDVVRRQFLAVLSSTPETFAASWRAYVTAEVAR